MTRCPVASSTGTAGSGASSAPIRLDPAAPDQHVRGGGRSTSPSRSKTIPPRIRRSPAALMRPCGTAAPRHARDPGGGLGQAVPDDGLVARDHRHAEQRFEIRHDPRRPQRRAGDEQRVAVRVQRPRRPRLQRRARQAVHLEVAIEVEGRAAVEREARTLEMPRDQIAGVLVVGREDRQPPRAEPGQALRRRLERALPRARPATFGDGAVNAPGPDGDKARGAGEGDCVSGLSGTRRARRRRGGRPSRPASRVCRPGSWARASRMCRPRESGARKRRNPTTLARSTDSPMSAYRGHSRTRTLDRSRRAALGE
jgi:hypothetical protein